MGGKQSTAARSRGPFPGVSTDDSAVPPPGGAPHFGHYRAGGGAMGLRSRSVSSVAGMGMDPSTAGGVPFGLYTPASRGTGDSERAPSGGGSASDGSTYAQGNGYQETGGGHHRDGMLYLGSRASLADALPLHIAPRWFSSHSGESAGGGGGPGGWSARKGVLGRPKPWRACERVDGECTARVCLLSPGFPKPRDRLDTEPLERREVFCEAVEPGVLGLDPLVDGQSE
ncbi:E3 ubiquitin-protein ligase ZNRF1 [Myotis brandtii]|uniref:RING-type E3 ubiquitin transferase n=1 Tax=Myotis brandtii TaxID=109478 RepID=S7MML4_MYOBR|nr:E3 ubiquitin-protein ligase ZNRF1 [Myotis brandtii]